MLLNIANSFTLAVTLEGLFDLFRHFVSAKKSTDFLARGKN